MIENFYSLKANRKPASKNKKMRSKNDSFGYSDGSISSKTRPYTDYESETDPVFMGSSNSTDFLNWSSQTCESVSIQKTQ